jgi:hypothetical protein
MHLQVLIKHKISHHIIILKQLQLHYISYAPMEAAAVEPCRARGAGSPTAGVRLLHIDGGGSAHSSRRWSRLRISARLPPQIVVPLLGSSCSVVVGAIGRDGAARASPKP